MPFCTLYSNKWMFRLQWILATWQQCLSMQLILSAYALLQMQMEKLHSARDSHSILPTFKRGSCLGIRSKEPSSLALCFIDGPSRCSRETTKAGHRVTPSLQLVFRGLPLLLGTGSIQPLWPITVKSRITPPLNPCVCVLKFDRHLEMLTLKAVF